MRLKKTLLALAMSLTVAEAVSAGFDFEEEDGRLQAFNHGTLGIFSPKTGTANYLSFHGKPMVQVEDVDLVGGPRLYAEPAVVKYLPEPWKIGTNSVEIVSEIWFVDHTKARHRMEFIFENDGRLDIDSRLEQLGTNTLKAVGLEWMIPKGEIVRRTLAATGGAMQWRQSFSRRGEAAEPKLTDR